MFRCMTRFRLNLGLMIGIFTDYEEVEHLEEYLEEQYDSHEYKLTWLLVTFPALHNYFMCTNMHIYNSY